jgi:hypothetical protein
LRQASFVRDAELPEDIAQAKVEIGRRPQCGLNHVRRVD